jgi:hypothetical protein
LSTRTSADKSPRARTLANAMKSKNQEQREEAF